jgi:hypothetical protein
MTKRLIEYDLPLADISDASAHEKNIRHGPPSTLHIWWAWRPLASYRARSGAIRLSSNEWKKARHFGDKFWLYVVTEAGPDEPELHPIQNPAARFRVGQDIVAIGYIIHEETWWGRAGR